MKRDGAELVYCRTCKRRHWTAGWVTCPDRSDLIYRDDSAYCPKRKARFVTMRHERTGRPMPI